MLKRYEMFVTMGDYDAVGREAPDGEWVKYEDAKTIEDKLSALSNPIPMVLHCPACGTQHIDAAEPDKGWDNPPHKSHLCHGCGAIWRPAGVPTTGVGSLDRLGEHDTWKPGDSTSGAGMP
jgi:hypothetical protein